MQGLLPQPHHGPTSAHRTQQSCQCLQGWKHHLATMQGCPGPSAWPAPMLLGPLARGSKELTEALGPPRPWLRVVGTLE